MVDFVEKKVKGYEKKGRDIGWYINRKVSAIMKKTGVKLLLIIFGGISLLAGIILSLFFRKEK